MRPDHSFDQAEAQTQPALGAALIASKQPIEDSRDLVRRDSASGVADAQQRRGAVAANLDIDASAGRGVLERVVDQVRSHLLQTCAVTHDNDTGILGARSCDQRHTFCLRNVAIEIDRSRHHIRQHHRLAPQLVLRAWKGAQPGG